MNKILPFLIFVLFLNGSSFSQINTELPGFIPTKPLVPEFSYQFSNEHEHDNIIPGSQAETNCPNSNFFWGTFAKWKGCKGIFDSPCELPFIIATDTVGINARFKIFPAIPPTFDPYSFGLLPTVFPGESFSARLGNSVTGAQAERLKYTILVTPQSFLFVYRYAVVLNDNNHTPDQQPSFEIMVLDSVGTLIDSCGRYYVFAFPGMPGWQTGPSANGAPVIWKDWTTVGMNLSSHIGKTLTIQFTTKDCKPTGHFGYAYISSYCSFLNLSTAMCEGDTSATLSGPPGFGYLWSTINGDTSINGDTTATIVVPNPTTGSTYTCILTAANGCQVQINTTLTYTQIHTGFTEILNCANRPSTFVDTTWVNQNLVERWRWNFGDPASGPGNDTSILRYPTHSFSAPGSYVVTLISFSTEGCADTMTKIIAIGPLPTMTSSPLVITLCSGEPLNYLMTSNQPATAWFNWRSFPRVPGNISGFTSNYINNNPVTTINDILINIGNTTDTVYYRIVPITSGCTGDSVTLKVAVRPYPDLINVVLVKSQCDSVLTNVDLNSHNDSTRFTWTCTASSVNLSGYSDNLIVPDTLINQRLRNNGYSIDTVYYHLTGHAYGCDGPTYIYKVAVFPIANLSNLPLSTATCDDAPVSIPLTTNVTGTNFTWTWTPDAGITGGTNNAIPTIILNQTLSNSLSTIGNATYLITPKANGCNGRRQNYIVSVYPTPVVVPNPLTLTICSEQLAVIGLSSLTPGTTFSWTCTPSSNKILGFSNGSGNIISQVLTDTSAVIQTVTYNITPTANGCTGIMYPYVVTVKPLPDVVFNPAVSVICSGQTVNINLTSHVAGITFAWTASASSPTVTGYSNGSGSVISQTLNTPGVQTETVTYTVTGSSNTCTGLPYTITVTINPTPILTVAPLLTTICSETQLNIPLLASYPAATFTWTVSNPVGTVTGQASGSGNLINHTLTNQIVTAGIVLYNITPAAGTCSGSSSVYTVNVNPKPLLTNTPPTSEICSNTSPNILLASNVLGTSFTWTATGSSINISGYSDNLTPNTLLNQTLINSGTVNETVTYIITPRANNCNGPPVNYVVTVHPVPAPTLSGNNNLCKGTTGVVYTTEPGRLNYSWSVSGGGIITAGGNTTSNTATVTWNTQGAQTISVTYSDPMNCPAAGPIVFPVTVNPLPIITLSGNQNICKNTTGVVYTTEAGKSNYSWVVSGGGSITSGGGLSDNTVTVTWNIPGLQTVSVNYNDVNNCTAVSPKVYNVTVNDLPVVTLSGTNALCKLTSGVVYSTQAGKTGYVWNISAGGTITIGGTATDNTATVTWNIPGAQNISVNYTDANGCTATTATIYNVTVHDLPLPVISGPAAICANTSAIYSTEAGMTNYSWTVSTGGTITSGSTTNSVTIQWDNTTGARTITVNYKSVLGCFAQFPTTYAVNINVLPIPSLNGVLQICEGNTTTYTSDAGMQTYIWAKSVNGTLVAGGGANDDFISIAWNVPGIQFVSVNYTVATGCVGAIPTQIIVTVHPRPQPLINGDQDVCETTTGLVYTTEAGKSNYTWVVSGGGTITSGGGLSDNTVTVTWNTAGARNVSVNYTDANNCAAFASTVHTVTIHPLPVVTVAGNINLCEGTTNVVYTSQASQFNYQWVVSSGGTITAGGTPTSSTVTVTWTTSGIKTVSLNYVDIYGCTAAMPFNLLVTVNPLPVITVSGTAVLCEGTTGVVYTTQTGHFNYLWSVSAGGTITAGGGVNDNTVTVSWITPGAKTVSVNYTDIEGCTAVSSASQNVTVNTRPVPALTGSINVCEATTGVVYTTEAGKSNYTWVVSGGGTITSGGGLSDNTVTVTWNTAGARNVSVNYTDANNCAAFASTVHTVTIHPLPVVTISGPANMCLNNTGTYFTEPGMNSYTWTVSSGGSITSGSGTSSVNILWSSNGANTITVNYINSNGCTATNAKTYIVNVNNLPSPPVNGVTSICTGFSTVYNTDAGMSNYIWLISAGGSITAGGTINDASVTVLWTGLGNQTVSINYTMGTGCTAPSPTIKNVTVYSLPMPVISGTIVLCAGSLGIVYISDPGMTNYQWTVTGGTISSGGGINDQTVTVQWLTAGAKTVSVNYTNINGCTALSPTQYPVTVNALPTPALNGQAAVCLNASGIYNTDAGMSNYQWIVPAGGAITSGTGTNTITVLWTTTGSKTITVNYNNINGCTAPAPSSFIVMVNPLPIITIAGPISICSGLQATYRTEKGMNTYLWNVSSGGSVVSGGSLNDSLITILWHTSGPNTVSVNYNLPTGCTAAQPINFNVTVKPRPAITNNITSSSICSGTSNNFILQPDLAGTTFAWTATGSSLNVNGFTSSSGAAISNLLNNTGTNIEIVTYIVTPTLNACDGTNVNFTTTVFPIADVVFTPAAQSFCSGGTTNINLSSNVAGTSFTWTATGGSLNINGFSPGSGTLIQQTLTNSNFLIESVTYNVYPLANSCPGNDDPIIVNVFPWPAVTFSQCSEVITITSGKPFTLKGGIPLGGTYSGPGVSAGIFNPSFAGPGTHTINYSYSNTWSCFGNSSQLITVVDPAFFTCGNLLIDIRDNKQYPTVLLGTQCWMAANLNYGTPITANNMQRDNCLTEKYCFNDITGNCTSTGGLYQWDEMMQYQTAIASQGVCPPGWHIPAEVEWSTLFNFYTNAGFAGNPLKPSGFSGYNAFFYGSRFDNVNWNFYDFATFFWSSSSHGTYKAWGHALNMYNPSVSTYPGNRSHALFVRCLKD